MRRRIRSDSELKKTSPKPPLVAHSRSVNLSSKTKVYDMQLIATEKFDSSATATECSLNPMQAAANVEIPSNDPESVLIPNIRNIPHSHDDACKNDTVTPIPSSAGRPTSLSSVTSSRTSCGSDYFSSSSAIESHQQTNPHISGSQIEIHSDSLDTDSSVIRPVLKKVVESVREEEEGFVDDNSVPPLSDPVEKHYNNSSNKLEKEHLTPVPEVYGRGHKEGGNLVSPKDINKKLSEVDYLSPIATMAMVANPLLTYVDRIILELLETERMYVRALEDILAGYVIALKRAPAGLHITPSDTENLFGNVKDIYAFNRKLLSFLENCDSDPVKIAQHFVSQDSSFSVYTEYCTNYPISVSVLTRCMKSPALALFFKNQQEHLRHNLPLGSYLLKPVQRILKYHLILQELVKNCDKTLKDFAIIEEALETMTNIAHHINEMKRKHEDAVHIQEIQSLLTNWQGDDLSTYGDIVIEGGLKLQGAKNDRLLFLFDKLILITKRREDGFLVCKANIRCSDLTMLESMKENPLSFRISPFDAPTPHNGHHGNKNVKEYTLIAKNIEEKKMWTHNIKKLMLKNHHAAIPLQAQQSILNMNIIGTDDQPFGEDSHRMSLRRITSSLSHSTFANGKPRRRSDSTSRKGLPLRPWKKLDVELSDEVSSDSMPNTPTLNMSKPRFSFPRIIHPQLDTGGENSQNPSESVDEKKDKKIKKNEPKKSEKYKESVIYRRHKRRTSQPITEFEKRLSVRAPSDVEDDDEAGKKTDVSLDNFESIEDFLSFNVDNKRESMSWDLQIVEPFFEQLKQEKEEKEARRLLEDTQSSILIPMPQRKRLPAAASQSSESSSSSEDEVENGKSQTETIVHQNESIQNISQSNLAKHHATNTNNEDEIVAVQVPSCEEKQIETTLNQRTSNEHVQNTIQPLVNEIAIESIVSKDETTKKAHSAVNAPVPKLKRSLSSQFSHNDRRRYFDRLKEIRDRRHSQINLGSDAKSIQAGKVREMIEQHHEQMLSSQSRLSPPSSQKRSSVDAKSCQRRSGSCDRDQNRKTSPLLTANRDEKINCGKSAVVLRKRRESERKINQSSPDDDKLGAIRYQAGSKKQNYRSMDLETADHNRFSSMTTASLPLQFTSSSSCSSECGNDDQSPSTTPRYKNILQSEMILWRSYSEGTDSNTRRSKNLVLQASPETKNQISNHRKTNKKFFLQDIGKIEVERNKKTDKMSEEVDCVWNDFEFGLKSPPNELNSCSPPSFLTKRERSSSTSETHFKRLEVIAINDNNTSILKKSRTLPSTSSKTFQNYVQSSTAQKRDNDVMQTKKAITEPEDMRQGRQRVRKNAPVNNEGKMSVMKLTEKYNQLSASSNPLASRPPYRRSQSAGARKHLSDLRFSTSSDMFSKGQVKYDDIITQTRTSFLGSTRKGERSVSPPRRRPLSAYKAGLVVKTDVRKQKTEETSQLISLQDVPAEPISDKLESPKCDTGSQSTLVEALCKPPAETETDTNLTDLTANPPTSIDFQQETSTSSSPTSNFVASFCKV